MKFSYYPGCTLKTKAKELDKWGREAAKALGAELLEIPDWQCCGAVYPQAEDEIATKLSAVRALASAKEQNMELVTLCSACHNVIKRTNDDMKNNEYISFRANNYLKLDKPYLGETKVLHYLEMLREHIGFENIEKAVVKPLKGVKIGAYYGCLLLRPSNLMAFDDPENPSIMEDFIKSLGATPVRYSLRNECCGAYLSLNDKDAAQKRSSLVLKSAKNAGCEMLITACPLCLYNLTNVKQEDVEVKYFTEILAQALGLKEED